MANVFIIINSEQCIWMLCQDVINGLWRGKKAWILDILRLDRILKKTKLELPSTWNVLWGDMSIVGNPAPSLPEFLDYSDYHRKSLSVKPGVFGFWQAYAHNGERLSEEEQSEFDREYILNCTLGLDIRICI